MTTQNDTPWWDTDNNREDTTPWWDKPDDIEAKAPRQDEKWWDDPAYTASADSPHTVTHMDTWSRIVNWVNANFHTVIYMAIGLCMAAGILKIGFWRTFLVALCLGGGYILGSWRDGNPQVMQRFKRFSRRWLDDNPFIKK